MAEHGRARKHAHASPNVAACGHECAALDINFVKIQVGVGEGCLDKPYGMMLMHDFFTMSD